MDMLTLKAALKRAAQNAASYAAEALQAAKDYADTLVFTDESVQASNFDRKLSYGLLLVAFRQHIWQAEDDELICEEGTVSMTNNLNFPFNNSQKTVALSKPQKNTKYVVIVDDVTAGNVGEIIVTDKQVNGFKIAYTGSAASATAKYTVIGGII